MKSWLPDILWVGAHVLVITGIIALNGWAIAVIYTGAAMLATGILVAIGANR